MHISQIFPRFIKESPRHKIVATTKSYCIFRLIKIDFVRWIALYQCNDIRNCLLPIFVVFIWHVPHFYAMRLARPYAFFHHSFMDSIMSLLLSPFLMYSFGYVLKCKRWGKRCADHFWYAQRLRTGAFTLFIVKALTFHRSGYNLWQYFMLKDFEM